MKRYSAILGKHDISTVVAIATATGKGPVGIVRMSGPLALKIACQIARITLDKVKPRRVLYRKFYTADGELLDQGLLLLFRAPSSFTGEDMAEFQVHGTPIVLNSLVDSTVSLGAEQAQAGEFSRRAYLNGKMDLTQAEGVADLINSESKTAVLAAQASIQGNFAQDLENLNEMLVQLRVYTEASLDFPDEDIDFLQDKELHDRMDTLCEALQQILKNAQQAVTYTEETLVSILGEANAGKSSLFNALCQMKRSIISDTPGTTRDFVQQTVTLDGRSFMLVDTAGVRNNPDPIEEIGINHAWQQARLGDKIILLYDGQKKIPLSLLNTLAKERLLEKTIPVENKSDKSGKKSGCFFLPYDNRLISAVRISAKTGEGIDALIKILAGKTQTAPRYSVRHRHLKLLEETSTILSRGATLLIEKKSGELLAEELKTAQRVLEQITGTREDEELLNEIFSKFCIGK